MSSAFEVGDVIRLKSGGLSMVITSKLSDDMQKLIGGDITTAWHNNNGDLCRGAFNAVELEYANDE